MTQSIRPWIAAIGIVPVALLLTGCFGGPSLPGAGGPGGNGADPAEEELVEDMLEGSGQDIDYESGALPADFPVDDIPLVDGEIAQALSVAEGQAWMVYINVRDEATAESAEGLLEAAGFTNDAIGWEKDAYLVLVIPQESEDGWVVYYQVQVQE